MTHHQQLDLPAIRRRLESRRQELVQREQRVTQDLTHRDQALSADSTEQAIETQNDETLQAIGSAAEQEIAEIDAALRRMDDGVYGVCRKCAQPIAPPRLAAQPQAVTCAACAR